MNSVEIMTYRVVTLRGTRGRIVWRDSRDAVVAEVRTESERLDAPEDFVRVSFDRDELPLLEVRA